MPRTATTDTRGDDKAAAPSYRTALVTLMRAHDTYNVWTKKSDEEVLGGFVLPREQRRTIPVIGDPGPKVRWRLEVFYTAVSYAITRRTGLDATPMITLSDEGFGRAVILVGRLVVLMRTLRDVHRFGFESTEALAEAGESLLAESLARIEQFPDVARAG